MDFGQCLENTPCSLKLILIGGLFIVFLSLGAGVAATELFYPIDPHGNQRRRPRWQRRNINRFNRVERSRRVKYKVKRWIARLNGIFRRAS